MKEYARSYPLFALCGLNCGLCPRYQTDGASRCPGCGGPDFHLKHPSCGVISCSQRHGGIEYCFLCSAYPCERYSALGEKDSFVSYRNVLADFEKAKREGIEKYKAELDEKVRLAEYLISNYNDGRRKSFYCNAVNLLPLRDVKEIINEIDSLSGVKDSNIKEKARYVVSLFQARADKAGIQLELRK